MSDNTYDLSKVIAAESGGGGGNVNLTQVGGSSIAIGQATESASLPVVIASNQSAVPVSGSVTATQATGTNLHVVVDSAPTTAVTGTFFQATQPVSGTVTANQGTSPWITQASSTPAVTIQTVGITSASSGDNTLIAAVSGKKIYVFAWNLSFSGTVNAKFTDGAAGTLLSGLYYGIVNAGAGNSVPPPNALWVGSTNTALVLNLSAAVAVGGSVSYYSL